MAMEHECNIRQEICEIGRRLWTLGFTPANAGNISVRLDDSSILCTPTEVSKGFMEPQLMVHIRLDGRLISAGRPSSEVAMHLAVYRALPHIQAVVHAHPAYSTAYAAAGEPLPQGALTEVEGTIGAVASVPFAQPGTEQVPQGLAPYLADHVAFLLANHGALTIGRSLREAYEYMEILEHFAKIAWLARHLGGVRPVPCASGS